MKVYQQHYRSVWADFQKKQIFIIDQTLLPFRFEIKSLSTVEEILTAIQTLQVRGAPAIGITGAYALWLSYYLHQGNIAKIENDKNKLIYSRPTAINLAKGIEFVWQAIQRTASEEVVYNQAETFATNELESCKQIGLYGIELIEAIYKQKQQPVNILTHCNAGWLACGDYGTALAPVFEAHQRKIPIHVWVDETRPLNQGSRITAWELHNENIPYHIIADNTGGLLMMNHLVDMVLVGADRITANGDVANKIGTYLKALCAKEHHIPFYVAAPLSTFDFSLCEGKDIIIEERNPNELKTIKAKVNNELSDVVLLPDEFSCKNYAFDVTPAKFIDAYITEKGIVKKPQDLTL